MKHLKYLFLPAIVASVLFSCGKKKDKTEETIEVSAAKDVVTLTDAQQKEAAIEVLAPKNQNIANKVRLSGMIDVPPLSMASVSSPTSGYVRVSRFMPGNSVSRGQTLAVIEDPDMVQLQQDYLLARSNSGYAQKDYERQRYLNKFQAASDKAMQKAQADAQNQNILMRGMAQKLRSLGINPNGLTANNIRTTVAVTSPISGKVSAVNVNIGQYVSASEKLFYIFNTSDIHLALKVFEKDLGAIAVGQRVYAYTNQNPDKKYPAEIILISKDFGPDRSVLVHCHFLDHDPILIPGTYMNAEVETETQESWVVPDDAIVTWEDKQYLFEEVKPKTYKMIPVTIGISEKGYTQLLNFGVENQNKRFVTKGAYQLLMALKNVEE